VRQYAIIPQIEYPPLDSLDGAAMKFGEVWHAWGQLVVLSPVKWEYSMLGVHVLVLFLLLVYTWPNFRDLDWRRSLLFFFLAGAGLACNSLLVPRYPRPAILPVPGAPVEVLNVFAPFFADLPIALAAALLGPGPAMLVGLVQGIGRGFLTVNLILDPFYPAFFGFAVGVLLQQEGAGKIFGTLRQPTVALPAAAVLVLPLRIMLVFSHVSASRLAGLAYAASFVWASAGPYLLKASIAGVFLQLVYWVRPSLRAVPTPQPASRFIQRLRSQLFWSFVPVILVFGVASIYVVTANGIQIAKARLVEDMALDANIFAADVPHFLEAGHSLLADYVADEGLKVASSAELQRMLQSDLEATEFFDQLVLLDPEGESAAASPAFASTGPVLASDEQLLLEKMFRTGVGQVGAVRRGDGSEPMIFFLIPAEYGAGTEGARSGALLGRTRADTNGMLGQLLDELQWSHEGGEAFLVDGNGRIAVHTDPAVLSSHWEVGEGSKQISEVMGGRAYETRGLRGNSWSLTYALPVPGCGWTVVIELPYALVLEDAISAVVPLVLLQAVLLIVLLVAIPVVLRGISRPVAALAESASGAAAGDLDFTLPGAGNSELGQISAAIEKLRQRLVGEQLMAERFLQAIAGNGEGQDTDGGISAVLDRVRKVSDARVVRLVPGPMLDFSAPLASAGSQPEGCEGLDKLLVEELSQAEDEIMLIPDLVNSEALARVKELPQGICALAARSVRLEGHRVAVLWLGYKSPRGLDRLEQQFLAAVASRLASLLENARLTQHLHLIQERLAAMLASTSDVVLVSDRDGQLRLANPAALTMFGVDGAALAEIPVSATGLPACVAELFAACSECEQPFAREVVMSDGRVLYASVSPVADGDSEKRGCVVVFRELSGSRGIGTVRASLISAFSEHLRTPLTLIRGYAQMLLLVGQLDQRQHQYLEKILLGARQADSMVDDLLALSIVESGKGLKRESVALGEILVEAVDSLQHAAAQKGVALRLEPAERMAVVMGDRSLLQQAVVNLVDNGLKYTRQGGGVAVTLEVLSEHVVICVADTGIGIDQGELPHIFERFYRSSRPEVAELPGVGLGLTIVKSIVEWHSGKLRVESRVGQGTKVYVGLPLGKRETLARVY